MTQKELVHLHQTRAKDKTLPYKISDVVVNNPSTLFFLSSKVVFNSNVSAHTMYHTILELTDCTEFLEAQRLLCILPTLSGKSQLTINTAGKGADWLWERVIPNSVTSSVEPRPSFKQFVQKCQEYLVQLE